MFFPIVFIKKKKKKKKKKKPHECHNYKCSDFFLETYVGEEKFNNLRKSLI